MLDKSPPQAGSQDGAVSVAGASSVAILVVGMHRSGTSALSGVLNKLGVAIPEDLHPADEHNSRGYFEPERIIGFHERLLTRLGSPSDDPLPLTYDWVGSPVGAAAAEELAEILDEEFGENPICLFKDPRICRLVPVWTQALVKTGRAGVAVLPYRDPLEVAGSLAAKAGVGRAYALFMWLQHVILGERFTRETPRSFAAYSELMEDWRAVSAKLQRELGLSWPKDQMRAAPEVDAFLTRELRHHQSSVQALDPTSALETLCARAWAGLERFNADPYDQEGMAAFDAIWAEFTAALAATAPLVVDYQRIEAGLKGELAHIRQVFGETMEARDNTILEHLEARQKLEALIAEKEAHLAAHTELRAFQVERIAQLDADLHQRELELREAIARQQELHQAVERSQQIAQQIWRDAQRIDADAKGLAARLGQIETSTFWALSHPLRKVLSHTPPGLRRAARGAMKLAWWTATLKLGRKLRERALAGTALTPTAESPAPEAAQLPASLTAAPPPVSAAVNLARVVERAIDAHVIFISGEAHTPGHRYRIVRWAEAAERAGATTAIIPFPEADQRLHEIRQADMVFIWRTAWDPVMEKVVDAAKQAGAPIVYDIDDLMFEPSLAKSEIIDGIRSQGFKESDVAEHFERVQKMLHYADFCTAPTPYLAERMRARFKTSFVLPNGFDEDVMQRSRLAARREALARGDGLVRIGYATGSKTHQADFAQCADAVADVLRKYPQARLVLFESREWPFDGPVLKIHEFPVFEGLDEQIEWRNIVPIEQLPDELARFDISIAPLEAGNPFCEAKSELKFFESALVDVPTVASPTEPYRLAIRDGVNGFLAPDREAWFSALSALVEDAQLRKSIARTALYDSLWDFGPERRVELFLTMMEQVLESPRRAGRAFELELARHARPPARAPYIPPHEVVLESDRLRTSEVTVIVPLYNYERFIVEALDSVARQTLGDIDLVVVDDASTDGSLGLARNWIEGNLERFNRVRLVRNLRNAGLGFTRNVGFANAETTFVLPLDADNRLRPDCAAELLSEAKRAYAALAYPRIIQFGDVVAEMGYQRWLPQRLTDANYVDAMALVRRSAWAVVGGYDHVRYGWEDYDLWCRFAEHGMYGVAVPKLLAEYRVHGGSMLRTETELLRNKMRLIEDMERRHPWLRITRPPMPDGAAEAIAAEVEAEREAAEAPPTPAEQAERLKRLLPILRCPETGEPLKLQKDGLRAPSGKLWPLLAGRPVLTDRIDAPQVMPDAHVSGVPKAAIELIEATNGLVLNLSAGGTPRRWDHVVEAEMAVFRHTDLLADAHALPFADASFELVISMNAFEHYQDPQAAAAEILRVLKPGGRVLVRTAFLQPLHEAPWHYYNATRFGLERWFEGFETERLQVSDNFSPAHAMGWLLSEAEATLRREASDAEATRFAAAPAGELIGMWRKPESRSGPLWRSLTELPQAAQEPIAAGFEYLGRKPL